MRTIDSLKLVAEAYAKHLGLPLKTVSHRVFDDGKKLDAIFDNSTDVTTGRLDAALQWFSDHWPTDLAWPASVRRPPVTTATQAQEAVAP